MNNFREHFASLSSFTGRETRSKFWPYALLVLVPIMLVLFLLMASSMSKTFSKYERYAAEHPEQAQAPGNSGTSVRMGTREIRVQGHHPELTSDMTSLAVGAAVAALLVVTLLGSAVVRRLHDVGRSWGWGAVPAVCLAVGIGGMSQVMNQRDPNLGLFLAIFLNNMIYLGTLLRLFLFLVSPGSEQPNKYGARPRRGSPSASH